MPARARPSKLRRGPFGSAARRASLPPYASLHAYARVRRRRGDGRAGGNGGGACDGAARSACDGVFYGRIFCGRASCQPSPLFCLPFSQLRLPGLSCRLCPQQALLQASWPVWRQRCPFWFRLPRLTCRALASYWALQPGPCLPPEPHRSWRCRWQVEYWPWLAVWRR